MRSPKRVKRVSYMVWQGRAAAPSYCRYSVSPGKELRHPEEGESQPISAQWGLTIVSLGTSTILQDEMNQLEQTKSFISDNKFVNEATCPPRYMVAYKDQNKIRNHMQKKLPSSEIPLLANYCSIHSYERGN